MTYELAKQLKDSGFTFTPMELGQLGVDVRGFVVVDHDEYWQPALSELIEACGKHFSKLCLMEDGMWLGKKWLAYGSHWVNEGDSPEEAVALLWLALKQELHAPARQD